MIKTYKNIPSLHRFVELAPIDAIRKLLTEQGNGQNDQAFASIEWPNGPVANDVNRDFRFGVLDICVGLDAKVSAPLDGHSRRIITLSEGKGIEAIQAVRDNLYLHDDDQQSAVTEYDAQQDHFGRATVIYRSFRWSHH